MFTMVEEALRKRSKRVKIESSEKSINIDEMDELLVGSLSEKDN